MTLTLEKRAQDDTTLMLGSDSGVTVMATPAIDEDYWEYRVRLTERQSVVGFPKFLTIGIGFAVEDYDWNTNLPYQCDTDEIVNHIWKNRGDESITRESVVEAVRLIQAAAVADRD